MPLEAGGFGEDMSPVPTFQSHSPPRFPPPDCLLIIQGKSRARFRRVGEYGGNWGLVPQMIGMAALNPTGQRWESLSIASLVAAGEKTCQCRPRRVGMAARRGQTVAFKCGRVLCLWMLRLAGSHVLRGSRWAPTPCSSQQKAPNLEFGYQWV